MNNIFKKNIKCVIVGDSDVGKTTFATKYYKTKMDYRGCDSKELFEFTYVAENRPPVPFSLVITPSKCCQKLRILSYPKTDVVLIFFSLDSEESFNNVKAKWRPEIHQHCPNAPVILVGTKADLREQNSFENIHLISRKQAEKMRKEVNADKYIEFSASCGEKELMVIIDEAVLAADPPIEMQGWLVKRGGSL